MKLYLENEYVRVGLDKNRGTVVSIYDKSTGAELLSAPFLFEAFRLNIPLSTLQQANYVFSGEQKLTSCKTDGNSAELFWKGPLKTGLGSFNISVRLRVILDGAELRFKTNIENNSKYTVSEAWLPQFGCVKGLGKRADTKLLLPIASESTGANIFRNFSSSIGIGSLCGNEFAEAVYGYPTLMPMPWIDIYNPKTKRGFYFAAHDKVARYKALRFEMHPGFKSGTVSDNWPKNDEGFVLGWVSLPHIKPENNYESFDVVLQFHDGDWHEGAKIYRKWFKSNFKVADPKKSWIRSEPAFQDIICMLPEGNILYKYKDIPKFAKDGLKYGVKSILISGWFKGGHDNMYPYYEPDPRLGTWKDLEKAVRDCHKAGVKVFFFANLQQVDNTTGWYKKELHKYESRNLWGQTSPFGFGMGTMVARLGITAGIRPMVNCNPWYKEFRDIITKQMVKLVEIGADGIHFDKFVNSALDFNPGTRPDTDQFEGSLQFLREVQAECGRVNPEFALSLESSWDRTFEFNSIAWKWPSLADRVQTVKYTFPQWTETMGITQPFDRNVANNCLRFGSQMLIGMSNYTKSMDDKKSRELSKYIKELLRIWEAEKETLYFGEWLDNREVNVTCGKNIRFGVFKNNSTGKRACVLVNLGDENQKVSMNFEGKNVKATLAVPYEKQKTIKLPYRSDLEGNGIAVISEQ